MALQADGRPRRLTADERAGLYQRLLGVPGGTADVPRPSREFEDLWLRFVASVAQWRHVDAREPGGLAAQSARVAAATQALATVAAPLVEASFAARDQWQVIDEVGAAESGGAVNRTRYRTMAESGGAILEWLAGHAAAAPQATHTDLDLLNAVEQWLAVSGTPESAVQSASQPAETVARWSQGLLRAAGLEENAGPEGKGPPRITALFTGAPGTGKTLAAHWLAASFDLDVRRIDLASVVSRYIGETEKNLEAVFRQAERSGSLLLFDEAEALFGERSEVRDSHDRYANVEVNYLLQRIESCAGLAILTSNTTRGIDPALLQRMRVVAFPLPSR